VVEISLITKKGCDMKMDEWKIWDIQRKRFTIIEDWIWYRLFEIPPNISPKSVLCERLSNKIQLLFDKITENSKKAMEI